ncbi:glucose-6-phosphate isomerase [Patulibacter sp. NPDC049589]|uniref:glucose-6-phosphate isomerase n=1 Tax=Patulibacter sp. NPDC049589 TaxID=3154731 RepID=UPI00342DC2CD
MSDPTPPALRWHLTDEQRLAVDAEVARAAEERVPERLWDRDDTLWGPAGQAEVSDRLGWLDAPARGLEEQTTLEDLAAAVASEGFTDVVLVGMGGSSLAPEVVWHWSGPQNGRLRLRMLDSTDPDAVATVDAATEPERTLVLVSTKSGGTLETVSLFRHFWSRNPDGKAFVAVTDPGSGLEAMAKAHGFRAIFHGDPEIGGRYSALSPFGTVPAALTGADLGALLHGAVGALEASRAPVEQNAAVRLGAAIAALAKTGRDKLALRVQDPRLGSFGLWLEQLVAESTGKHGHGVLPVVDDPAADHGRLPTVSSDRQLLVLRGTEDDAELTAAIEESTAAGVPVLELIVAGDGALGAAFAAAEVATAVVGWGLGINPFDQPDVQAAKDATKVVLAEVADGTPIPGADEVDPAAVLAFVDGLAAPEYLAILAYLPPSADAAAEVGRLRTALAGRTDAAITTGFGPRYLHSTGQLHKGGPAVGRYLILEHDPRAERTIPAPDSEDEPSNPTTSFRTLFHAQSQGDLRTLGAHDRPVLRVSLGSDWLESLAALTTAIQGDS